MGLVVAVGVCSTLGGVAGCNTQSLVPIDGGPARSGTGGGSGNRSGSAGGGIGIGTTGAGGAGGDGGDIPTGFGGDVGAGGVMGTSGAGGITGAAGFGRPFGGAAGHGVGLGGGAGNGGSPVDASTTTSPQDAGDCQCVLGADGVLRMSWDCFTTYFGGGAAMSGWCGGPGGWITSCGLDVFKLDRDNAAIPDDEWAYDPSGNLVGQQIAETSPVFVCPTAPTLWPAATVVAAGQFPASGCAVSDCTCGDAGAVSCPVPDAGTTPINPF